MSDDNTFALAKVYCLKRNSIPNQIHRGQWWIKNKEKKYWRKINYFELCEFIVVHNNNKNELFRLIDIVVNWRELNAKH